MNKKKSAFLVIQIFSMLINEVRDIFIKYLNFADFQDYATVKKNVHLMKSGM